MFKCTARKPNRVRHDDIVHQMSRKHFREHAKFLMTHGRNNMCARWLFIKRRTRRYKLLVWNVNNKNIVNSPSCAAHKRVVYGILFATIHIIIICNTILISSSCFTYTSSVRLGDLIVDNIPLSVVENNKRQGFICCCTYIDNNWTGR